MPRFLHTADWQIGRRYAQFNPDDAAHVAEERTNAVARIAALAAERQVDAVLVAGDVFDLQTVGDRVIRRLFAAMAGYAGPWVMIPGNHDAALAESVWTQAQRLGVLPAQLHLALVPGVVLLEACKTAVLAAPLTQRHTYTDTTEFFDAAATPEGWLRVGLAHGSVEGILPDEIDSANPISSARCASARLDYLALGDWHGFKSVNERCAYSGTPEQDRFRGNAPGFCLIVDLAPGRVPTIEPVRVGRYTWHDRALEVAVASDIERVCDTLAAFGPDDIAQVRISGRTDLAGQRRIAQALGRAEAAMRSLQHDLVDLRLLPTDEDLATLHADGYLAEVIDELRSAQQQGQAADSVRVASNTDGVRVASNIDSVRVAREALALLCAELDSAATAAPQKAGA